MCELAREKLENTTFIQEVRVIVDLLREQARSYKNKIAALGLRFFVLHQALQRLAQLSGNRHRLVRCPIDEDVNKAPRRTRILFPRLEHRQFVLH